MLLTGSVVIEVTTSAGGGSTFVVAQKPPIGWRLTVTEVWLCGSRQSGGAYVLVSSGT